jgi:LytR cell envelope-related transcriptional attenuator
MAAIPFALSISHFVNSVGAKAGFAAIIGLAILVLLFFAQARETATLRDRAADSEEHVQQLELRIAQLARGTAPVVTGTPAPAPAPPGVQRLPAAPAVAAAAAPAGSRVAPPPALAPPSGAPLGAPAGVGAPALNAATRLIPGVEAGAISIRATGASAPASTAAAAAAGARPAARAVGAPASGGPPAGSPSRGAAVMTPPGSAPSTPPGPAPSTAAGGANGGTGTRVPPPAPAPVPAPPPASARVAQPPPRGQIRSAPTRPASSGPRRAGPPPPGRSGISPTVLVIAGLLAVAAVVVVLLLVTSGGSSPSSSSSSSARGTAASAKHRRGGRSHVALTPSAITVSVLNGTSTPNLAAAVSNRLGSSGYKAGRVTNAVDQGLTSTIVGYLSGHRAAALLVAKSLGLGQASVQAVDPSNESVACPSSSSCSAQVVVAVGGDLASSTPNTSASTT